MPAVHPIEVHNLVKRYHGVTAVEGVSFSVAAGACLALLGPNGAGKTSTVECIEGYRQPDGGTVRVLGFDPVADREQVVGHVGVMLQGGGAYPAANPRELVHLYARFYAEPRDPAEILELVGLTGRLADAKVRGLSGGERQRLSLALALVGRPTVLCLDEPTAGMDPQARRTTKELIAELTGGGCTVLLTTHDLQEAAALASQVAIMSNGQLRALDTPARLAAGSREQLTVTYDGEIDAEGLAAAAGALIVSRRPGQVVLDTGPAAIHQVSDWFAANKTATLSGVSADHGGLEAAYLRLIGDDAAEGEA